MKTFLIVSTLIFSSISWAETKEVEHELLLIVGAPGEERFANGFQSAASAWEKAAASTNASITIVGLEESDKEDRALIEEWVTNLKNDTTIPAWIVYIGHGTHTQKSTLLNLRGPDLSCFVGRVARSSRTHSDFRPWGFGIRPIHQSPF